MAEKPATKWGIVSAGHISNDFTACLESMPNEHKVVAVAARNLEAAEKFAKKFNIPKAYAGYEALAKDADIEIVYIGSLNPSHLPITRMMLNAGKHVLCEKPMGMNANEVRAMCKMAKEKGLFLMEAIWSRFTPGFDLVRKEISSGTVGELKVLQCNFAYQHTLDRAFKKELGAGTAIDMGVYGVQLANMLFPEKPEKITAVGHLSEEGVDLASTITLQYPGGRICSLLVNVMVDMTSDAFIAGTKGLIIMHDPFRCPTQVTTPKGTFDFPLPILKSKCNFPNSEGLTYQAIEVRRCINAGLKESPLVPHKDSIAIHEILDEVRKQLGVRYPQDDAI